MYDHYVTWSARVRDEVRRRYGVGCHVVPFGFDAKEHVPEEPDGGEGAHIGFVGSWDPFRQETLQVLSEEVPLVVAGPGWREAQLPSARVCSGLQDNASVRKVVANSAGCINLLRRQNSGDHNMRSFELPAMGGVMICPATDDHQRWFPDAVAAIHYSSLSDLRSAVGAVVDGSVDGGDVRRNAKEAVAGHSYAIRARRILELVR